MGSRIHREKYAVDTLGPRLPRLWKRLPHGALPERSVVHDWA